MKDNRDPEELGGIVAFRATATLMEAIEKAAAVEGVSKSDIARRACIRDLRGVPYVGAAA